MSKINYNEIKSLQSIQNHKEKLQRKIKKQESKLAAEWNDIKNPFKQYIPIAQSAVKTLTLIPVLLDGFMVGKKVFTLILNKFQKK